MTSTTTKGRTAAVVLLGLAAAALPQANSLAADAYEDALLTPRAAPRMAVTPAEMPSETTTPAAGTLKVGGMLVRLEEFREMRDGRVQAQMSFRNLDTHAPASVALPASAMNPQHADAIGEVIAETADPKSVVRLSNAQGISYRLTDMSQMGDIESDNGWMAVAPGGSAFLTAVFTPDGAAKGVQPFALSLPLRMQWQPADASAVRTSSFEVNFRGLHRTSAVVTAAAARAEPVSLLPAPAPPLKIASAPMTTGQTTIATRGDDDLTPLIARMPAARLDAHRYLFAVGVEEYDDAPAVPFAEHSARTMADLLRKRYGIPEDNISIVTAGDATGMKILGRLNSLIQRLTPGDTVYFYYAGHGLSARDGSAVYVVPKDAVPGAYETEMLSLESLLHRFETSNATRVVAFLDTCFSGRVGQHESLFPGVSPLIPTALPATLTETLGGGTVGGRSGKTTLFLAGQAYQFANDYPEHGYRLFSYFLMRGLLEGKDDPAALETFVAQEVRRVSAKRGAEFLQEPQLQGATLSLAAPQITAPRSSRLH